MRRIKEFIYNEEEEIKLSKLLPKPSLPDSNIFDKPMHERHPSQTPSNSQIERMREIIIGRQLGKLEHRLDRLERNLGTHVTPDVIEPDTRRLDEIEAKFEAVRDAMQQQMEQMRREWSGEMVHRKQEVRRLAEQIQIGAQAKMNAASVQQELAASENRLLAWVAAWQQSLEQHLEQREHWLIGQLREELQRHALATQPDQRAEIFQEKIATAAQSLSQTATLLSQLASALTPHP
jgi:type I site-specific restriction-modification system R (restriction) subunit